jgi:hypothetical protein
VGWVTDLPHIFEPRSVANLPQLLAGEADVFLLVRSQESVWR